MATDEGGGLRRNVSTEAAVQGAMRARLTLAALTAALLSASVTASAQVYPGGLQAVPDAAPDDVAWETVREPYYGGPVRPGAELDAYPGGLTLPGALGLVLGYGLSFAAIESRPISVVPIVGPWLALANVTEERAAFDDGVGVALAIGGVLQPLGIAALVIGLAIPDVYLVFDAPVAVLPRVSGGEVGLDVVGSF